MSAACSVQGEQSKTFALKSQPGLSFPHVPRWSTFQYFSFVSPPQGWVLLVLLDRAHIQDAGFPPRRLCLPDSLTEAPAVCQPLAQAVSSPGMPSLSLFQIQVPLIPQLSMQMTSQPPGLSLSSPPAGDLKCEILSCLLTTKVSHQSSPNAWSTSYLSLAVSPCRRELCLNPRSG